MRIAGRRAWSRAVLPVVAFVAAFVPSGLIGTTGWGVLGPLPIPAPVPAVLVGVLAAAAAVLLPARRWPLFVVAALATVALSPGLLLALAAYLAATGYRRPMHLVAFAVPATALAALPRPGGGIDSLIGGVALFVWLPLMVGLWVAARRQVLDGLRERAERSERERDAHAERARAQERARIARDMHDVVAHRVSLMVLHAGAVEINATDERTATEAELIRTTGREALAQLRAVLGLLEQPGDGSRAQPTLADLDALLDRSRAAGVPVRRRDDGDPTDLPTIVEQAAYRVVQESLTNIHKHAGTASTCVTLCHEPGALTVRVHNAAPATPPAELSGSGLGLVALRERVEFLGGRFCAEEDRDDGGFVVTAVIPT